jgi:hypothetical protein
MQQEGYKRLDCVRQTANSLLQLFESLSGRTVSQNACDAVVQFRKQLIVLSNDFPLEEDGGETREKQLLAELLRIEQALSNCDFFISYPDSASFLKQLGFFKEAFSESHKGVN